MVGLVVVYQFLGGGEGGIGTAERALPDSPMFAPHVLDPVRPPSKLLIRQSAGLVEAIVRLEIPVDMFPG